MDWLTTALPLRLILLGAGFLFILALVWFDRRRRHQAGGEAGTSRDDADGASRAHQAANAGSGHSEPSLAAPTASTRGAHELSAHRPLPVIDWQALAREQGAADESGPRLAVHTMRQPGRPSVEPSLGGEADMRDDAEPGEELATSPAGPVGHEPPATRDDWPAVGAPVAPVFLGEPSVDHWPRDDQRRICSLRIVPRAGERLPGRMLRQALQGSGFLPGALGIFHYADAEGRALISAANLARPGELDPVAMDFQRYGGLHLFAVLPGPLPGRDHLQQLFSLSTELAERAGGMLQDERGAALTEVRKQELLRQFADVPGGDATAESPAA